MPRGSHKPSVTQAAGRAPEPSFSQLQLAAFEVSREHFGRKSSSKSFAFTTLTCSFGRKSLANASFSQLKLTVFKEPWTESVASQLQLAVLEEVSHERFAFATSTCGFQGSLARTLRFHMQVWSLLIADVLEETTPRHGKGSCAFLLPL